MGITQVGFGERATGHESGSFQVSHVTPIVSVVDGDVLVRRSLESLIRFAGWHANTFARAEAFLYSPRTFVPNCLVLGVSLPGLSRLDLQMRLAIERPHTPVIFITDQGDVPTAVQAMKAGAVEFFTKPFQDDLVLSAIREALERSVLALGLEEEMRALRNRYASLSPRERQVMASVVSGLMNKEVGAELGISEITVKAHRGRAMQKMQAGSFAHLVKMAAKLGVAAVRNDALSLAGRVAGGTTTCCAASTTGPAPESRPTNAWPMRSTWSRRSATPMGGGRSRRGIQA
jgi:FixJ family two-component response regulator